MPLLAFVSILFTYLYSDGNPLWAKMDSTLLARFRLGKQAFEEYGLKLFWTKDTDEWKWRYCGVD